MMQYRSLPHGGEKISVIGMGTSVVGEISAEKAAETFTYAMDHGINYFDFAGGHAAIFPGMGIALKGRRKDAMLQVHFGADYTSGEYGWNLSLDGVKKSVDWQMKQLGIDTIDFGFMHCLDEEADLVKYEKNGVLNYLLDMKTQGIVKHLGLSTHSPALANKVLDLGLIDMLMFSINPAYDYGQGEYAYGEGNERYTLYTRCEKEGVGISVMKPFNAGQLLDAKKSPFHHALTTAQCIQYALDRPGVVTVMQGAADIEQLKQNLAFLEASEVEKDYSIIGSFTPDDSRGRCVYCKHCHPCPAGLDIGLINKYYDLTRLGDVLAKDHYLSLNKTAQDCIGCGHCNSRCPFGVKQQEQMQEIRHYFGK